MKNIKYIKQKIEEKTNKTVFFKNYKKVKTFLYYYFMIVKKKISWAQKMEPEKHNFVEKILSEYPLIDTWMMDKKDLEVILTNLQKVLDNNIAWDVVELGCNVGGTSLFIRKLLDINKSTKEFHVYDSFEGLPEKSYQDEINNSDYKKGSCRAQKDNLIFNFSITKLKMPIIHTGWFGEIDDKNYPGEIAFAFFDGDFYSSILDSFQKVYPKLNKWSCIIIHDYESHSLPGVKKACEDFLSDKPEKWTMERRSSVGILIKK